LLDDQLYYKIVDGVLLKCLNQEEAKVLMGAVHEGICGAHQSAYKMNWIIHRSRYFLPIILEDCFEYYKGVLGLSMIWQCSKIAYSSYEPNNQAMVVSRLGNRFDQPNFSTFKQRT
jgi:hypothetical protein